MLTVGCAPERRHGCSSSRQSCRLTQMLLFPFPVVQHVGLACPSYVLSAESFSSGIRVLHESAIELLRSKEHRAQSGSPGKYPGKGCKLAAQVTFLGQADADGMRGFQQHTQLQPGGRSRLPRGRAGLWIVALGTPAVFSSPRVVVKTGNRHPCCRGHRAPLGNPTPKLIMGNSLRMRFGAVAQGQLICAPRV